MRRNQNETSIKINIAPLCLRLDERNVAGKRLVSLPQTTFASAVPLAEDVIADDTQMCGSITQLASGTRTSGRSQTRTIYSSAGEMWPKKKRNVKREISQKFPPEDRRQALFIAHAIHLHKFILTIHLFRPTIFRHCKVNAQTFARVR